MRYLLVVLAILSAGCAADTKRAAAANTPPATGPAIAPAIAPAKIDSFRGEYEFLSNFFPAVVEFEEINYPTVEHAYQSAKTRDMNERRRIAAIATPGEAKRAGRALKYRNDWEQVKFDVMEQCVRYKFTQHADLKSKLLATGDATLEEGNTWGDTTWGTVDGKGDNRLGKLLMKIRDEICHPAQHP